jgi:hypothetical protein
VWSVPARWAMTGDVTNQRQHRVYFCTSAREVSTYFCWDWLQLVCPTNSWSGSCHPPRPATPRYWSRSLQYLQTQFMWSTQIQLYEPTARKRLCVVDGNRTEKDLKRRTRRSRCLHPHSACTARTPAQGARGCDGVCACRVCVMGGMWMRERERERERERIKESSALS